MRWSFNGSDKQKSVQFINYNALNIYWQSRSMEFLWFILTFSIPRATLDSLNSQTTFYWTWQITGSIKLWNPGHVTYYNGVTRLTSEKYFSVQSTVYNNQNVTKSVQYVTQSYGRPRTKTEVTTNTYIHSAGDVTWASVMPRKVTVNIGDAENRYRGYRDKNRLRGKKSCSFSSISRTL